MAADTTDGKNTLFNDSKLGLLVTGALTVVIDGVLDGAINALSSVDPGDGNWGWGTTLISAAIATALGAVTAYKAKRDKAHNRL